MWIYNTQIAIFFLLNFASIVFSCLYAPLVEKDFAIFFTRFLDMKRFCDFLYTFLGYEKILRFSLHVIRWNL